MNMATASTALDHWKYVAPLFPARNDERAYRETVEALDMVLNAGGSDENHPLASLALLLGDIIEKYEAEHALQDCGTGIDALKFLMEQQGLKQSDLPEIGSQGVVSELLNGKRELNIKQIRKLAARFNVAESVFI